MWQNGKYAQGTSTAYSRTKDARGNAFVQPFELQAKLAGFLNPIFIWKNGRPTTVILTWVPGRQSLKKNQASLPLQGKHLTVYIAYDNIEAIKHQSEFWKFCFHSGELDSFPIPKDSSDE